MPYLIALLCALVFCSPLLIWLTVIRPYCVRHRKGHQTGANLMIALWVDWQTAKDLANQHGDRGIQIACRCFLAAHLFLFILFVLGLSAAFQ